MRKLLVSCAILPLFAGAAMAGQPITLTGAQMDGITAGAGYASVSTTVTGWAVVNGAYHFTVGPNYASANNEAAIFPRGQVSVTMTSFASVN